MSQEFTPGLISVVIPCRNEKNHIESCIQSILSSTYKNIEILVVDGMSDDGTREVLSLAMKKFDQVRLLDNERQLTPFAFNIGIYAARGEYIQIIGSRNELSPDYLQRLVSALQSRPELACVGGDYQHISDSQQAQSIAWAMESSFGVGGSNYRTQTFDVEVDTVGVPMYPSWVFEKIGYFDESLTRNQDDDFNFRVIEAGYKILYVHDAKCTYVVRSSRKKAFLQYFQYGYFKVFVNKKHGQLTTIRQLAPPAFVVFLFLGLLASTLSFTLFLIYLGVIGTYGLLGWHSSAKLTTNWKRRLDFQLSVLTLHIGYGLGYWLGFWDFFLLSRRPRTQFQRQTT